MRALNNEKRTSMVAIFPMMYCNGELHVGHLHVLIQLWAKLRSYSYIKKEQEGQLIFPYHTSGLPATFFFEDYLNGKKYARDIVDKMAGYTTHFTMIDQWFNTVAKYNLALLKKLEIPVTTIYTHFTATQEPNYNEMVLYTLAQLEKKGLIYEAEYNTLFCETCNNVVGDHDLKEETCIVDIAHTFIYYKSTYKLKANAPLTMYKSITDNTYWLLDIRMYRSLKHIKGLEICDYDIGSIEGEQIVITYPTLSKNGICRCGSYISIKPTLQTFIDYSNLTWQKNTIKLIQQMRLQQSMKVELINRAKDLRGWPLLRSRGIGTQYKGAVVDSLSDSPLFYIYSMLHPFITFKTSPSFWAYIFSTHNDESVPVIWQNVKKKWVEQKQKYWLQVSGKDLIQNHLIFAIFFNCLFELGLDEIFTTGHILVGTQKMSKSLGNVLNVSQLAQTYEPAFIKYLLLTSAQGTEDGNLEDVVIVRRFKQYTQLRKFLTVDSNANDTTLQSYAQYLVAQIIQQTYTLLHSAKYKTFYQTIYAFLNQYSCWLPYLTAQTLKSFTHYVLFLIERKCPIPVTIINYNKDKGWVQTHAVLVKLRKDISNWFKNVRRQSLLIHVPPTCTGANIITSPFYIENLRHMSPKPIQVRIDSTISTILFEQIK